MKKLLICIILLIATMLSSCIQVDPSASGTATASGEVTTPHITTADDPGTTDPPVPNWSGATAEAQTFLENTRDAIVDCTKREYSYEEMEDDLKTLAERYPTRFSYRSFGQSVAGRALYVATLGNVEAENTVLVSAGIHGREYLTPLLVMKQLEFYLYYYDSGECNGMAYAQLFEDCCFYIVPMTNPDGIMLSQAGIDSLTDAQMRQTVRSIYEADFAKGYTSQTDINEYLKFWKANANGVDLNRNFDALWENYRMGEPVPCHKNYKGPSAASEPETRALAALTDSLSGIKAVLCIHSQGEVLYWNCGQPASLSDATRNFTATLSHRTGYQLIEEQNNDASFSDWCALERGLIAVTVETGKGTCPLFIDKFPTIWYDNFDLLPLSAFYFEPEATAVGE